MADSTQLIPEDKNLLSQIDDQNLKLIILNIKETNLESANYEAILKFINNNKVDLKLIKEHEQKSKDVKIFIKKFGEIKDEFKIIDLISNYINEKGLMEFLYNFLILKETHPQNNVVTKIIKVLSNKTQEMPQANHNYVYEINDRLNNVSRILGEIGTSVSNTKDEQKKYFDDLFPDLVEQLNTIINEIIKPLKSDVLGISNMINEIPKMSAQDLQSKSIIFWAKNNSSLILQALTLFFIVTISLILFLSDILKPSVSETKVDSSKVVSDLNTNFSTSLKPITTSINNLDNKLKDLGTKGTQIKQLDEKDITKIKTEVDTVIKELFKDKKLIIDSDKMQILTTKIENLNTVAAPKEDSKGKGEEKKGKDNQPKGITPSHKVTLEDKNDIAKITSDSIKSIIEHEILKIVSNNDKSKNKADELLIKDKLLTELRINQEILKNDLEAQKKLVISKNKELLDVNNANTGFKGPQGSYAIFLTNSKDFELTEPILSATLGVVEKQIKESNGTQKLGIYTATGIKIDTKFNLKKGIRGLNPTEIEASVGRPTETIAEAGKTFLEYAFDDGKDPKIPINDRKAIIIATWSAGAPKDVDGWDKISQVDAILIQTPKANQLREGSAWLDFILKKNGRLLFVQAEEKISGSSPSIGQIQKHLSTLLNTKKD